MWTYANEQAAILDALRLARGMTYKYAAAGLDLGGGKAVIIGDPATDKSEALLRAIGRFIDRLGGAYITGEDVGTTSRHGGYPQGDGPCGRHCPRAAGGAGDIAPRHGAGDAAGDARCVRSVSGDRATSPGAASRSGSA